VIDPAHPPAATVPEQPHDREARLLADILRSARIALLFDVLGTEKTALLKTGLMPLLSRRAADAEPTMPSGRGAQVLPFPDRRRATASARRAACREVIVYFDAWADDDPLPALVQRIARAVDPAGDDTASPDDGRPLASLLAALHRDRPVNLIVVLDRFEELLHGLPARPGHARFASELVAAVNSPDLPANFLLALNEAARPRLQSLRAGIPGFDNFSLKLAPPAGGDGPPGAAAAAGTAPADVRSIVATAPVLKHAVAEPPLLKHPLDTGSGKAPLSAAPPTTAIRPPRAARPKSDKPRGPPVRAPLHLADVYAFIEAKLADTSGDDGPAPAGPANALANAPAIAPEIAIATAGPPQMAAPTPPASAALPLATVAPARDGSARSRATSSKASGDRSGAVAAALERIRTKWFGPFGRKG
jgi:hypothetical protein